MKKIPRPVGFIGAGNMAEAMIGALLQAGLLQPGEVQASDVSVERLRDLQDRYGIETMTDNSRLFAACKTVVLSIKPQQMQTVLQGIVAGGGTKGIETRKLVVSIAAGVRLQALEDALYNQLPEDACRQMPIVRVMPNTPALVQSGTSGMSPNRFAAASDLGVATRIFEAMGTVFTFPESALDAVTAVSGSGPAYVFYLIEAMIDGGVQAGLSRAEAGDLALSTVKGAALLMAARKEDPRILREKVTSPGGTTEAAVNVLDARGVKGAIVSAICAAARRSEELSK